MAQFQVHYRYDGDDFRPICCPSSYWAPHGNDTYTWPSFDEALAALNELAGRYRHMRSDLRVVVADNDLSDLDWQTREKLRFASGEHQPTPWHNEAWYQAKHEEHFCHVSKQQAGKIAFTENAAKGAADRQLVMSPGRYLNRYFNEHLDNTAIEGWCAKLSVLLAEDDLKITQDADEIEDVYLGGPESCMSKPLDCYDSCVHPVRVYAGPDTALAYIGSRDDAKARCVVWPERKIYTRVYGDVSRLTLLLEAEGYRQGDLDGARIQRIEHDDDYFVVPYIDRGGCPSDEGDYLRIGHGRIECGSTDGTARRPWVCPNCDDEEAQYATVHTDDGDSEYWCESCCDNDATICYHDGRRYPDSRGFTTVNRDSGPVEIMDDNLDAFGAVYIEDRSEYWEDSACGKCAATDQWFVLEDLTAYNGELLSEDHVPEPLDDEDETQANAHVLAYQQFKAEMAELHALADKWAAAGQRARAIRVTREDDARYRRQIAERTERERQSLNRTQDDPRVIEIARRYGYSDDCVSHQCHQCRSALDRARQEVRYDPVSPYSYRDMARAVQQSMMVPPRYIVDEFAIRAPAPTAYLDPGV